MNLKLQCVYRSEGCLLYHRSLEHAGFLLVRSCPACFPDTGKPYFYVGQIPPDGSETQLLRFHRWRSRVQLKGSGEPVMSCNKIFKAYYTSTNFGLTRSIYSRLSERYCCVFSRLNGLHLCARLCGGLSVTSSNQQSQGLLETWEQSSDSVRSIEWNYINYLKLNRQLAPYIYSQKCYYSS